MTPRTFEPTVYQTFTVKTDPSNVAPRLKALRAELARPRASTPSSSPAPTPIAASRCRPAKRASPTSPASPAPPASPSSASRRPASSSTAATSSRPPPRPTPSTSTCISCRRPASRADRRLRDGGRQDRLRSLAPHARPRSATSPKSSATARRSSRAANLVDRIWPDRPAAPVTPIEFLGHNRAGKTAAGQARRSAEGPRRGQGRRRRPHPARVDLLALQHARPRRAQHAVRPRLRHHPAHRPAHGLSRQEEDHRRRAEGAHRASPSSPTPPPCPPRSASSAPPTSACCSIPPPPRSRSWMPSRASATRSSSKSATRC